FSGSVPVLTSRPSGRPSPSVSGLLGSVSPGSTRPLRFLSSSPSSRPSPTVPGLVGSVVVVGSASPTKYGSQKGSGLEVRPSSTPSGIPSPSVSGFVGSVVPPPG